MWFVNFTREPIIETILSPKDGYKLCIKNSKITGAEEIFVDVVEVVSFGSACFFRGQERPKPFLVPVSDYEIFEVKETRVVLKNVSHDRNIKIGGGREAFQKSPAKEAAVVEEEVVEESAVVADSSVGAEGKGDKKRDRRRNRRKRLAEEKKETLHKERLQAVEDGVEESLVEEEVVLEEIIPEKSSSSLFAHLLPPPPTLISEKLGKLKEKGLVEPAVSLPAEPEEMISSMLEEVAKEEDFF